MVAAPANRKHSMVNINTAHSLECSEHRKEIWLRHAISEDLKRVDNWLRERGLYLHVTDGWRRLLEQERIKDAYIEREEAALRARVDAGELDRELVALHDRANSLFSDAHFTAPHPSGGAFDAEIRSIVTGREITRKPWLWALKYKDKQLEEIPPEDLEWFEIMRNMLNGYQPPEENIRDSAEPIPDWVIGCMRHRRLFFHLLSKDETEGGFLPKGHAFDMHIGEIWHGGRGDRTSGVVYGKPAYYEQVEEIRQLRKVTPVDANDIRPLLEEFIRAYGGDERTFCEVVPRASLPETPDFMDPICVQRREDYREFTREMLAFSGSLPVIGGENIDRLQYMISEILKNLYDNILSFYDSAVTTEGPEPGYQGKIGVSFGIVKEGPTEKLVIRFSGNGIGAEGVSDERKRALMELLVYTSQGDGLGEAYIRYFTKYLNGAYQLNVSDTPGGRTEVVLKIPLESLRPRTLPEAAPEPISGAPPVDFSFADPPADSDSSTPKASSSGQKPFMSDAYRNLIAQMRADADGDRVVEQVRAIETIVREGMRWKAFSAYGGYGFGIDAFGGQVGVTGMYITEGPAEERGVKLTLTWYGEGPMPLQFPVTLYHPAFKDVAARGLLAQEDERTASVLFDVDMPDRGVFNFSIGRLDDNHLEQIRDVAPAKTSSAGTAVLKRINPAGYTAAIFKDGPTGTLVVADRAKKVTVTNPVKRQVLDRDRLDDGFLFSPDGRFILVCESGSLIGQEFVLIDLYEAETVGRITLPLNYPHKFQVQWSPDSETILIAYGYSLNDPERTSSMGVVAYNVEDLALPIVDRKGVVFSSFVSNSRQVVLKDIRMVFAGRAGRADLLLDLDTGMQISRRFAAAAKTSSAGTSLTSTGFRPTARLVVTVVDPAQEKVLDAIRQSA